MTDDELKATFVLARITGYTDWYPTKDFEGWEMFCGRRQAEHEHADSCSLSGFMQAVCPWCQGWLSL